MHAQSVCQSAESLHSNKTVTLGSSSPPPLSIFPLNGNTLNHNFYKISKLTTLSLPTPLAFHTWLVTSVQHPANRYGYLKAMVSMHDNLFVAAFSLRECLFLFMESITNCLTVVKLGFPNNTICLNSSDTKWLRIKRLKNF